MSKHTAHLQPLTLNSGVEMPTFGFGAFQIHAS